MPHSIWSSINGNKRVSAKKLNIEIERKETHTRTGSVDKENVCLGLRDRIFDLQGNVMQYILRPSEPMI